MPQILGRRLALKVRLYTNTWTRDGVTFVGWLRAGGSAYERIRELDLIVGLALLYPS